MKTTRAILFTFLLATIGGLVSCRPVHRLDRMEDRVDRSFNRGPLDRLEDKIDRNQDRHRHRHW